MKKIIPIFAGWVKNGKVLLDLRSEFDNYVSSFEGKRVQLVLKKYKTQRSNEQNRYYWGVVIPILADYFGYFPEEMHNALGYKFLLISDGSLPRVRSTTDFTTTEAEIYYEQIRIWALTEFQVKIPLPNKVEV